MKVSTVVKMRPGTRVSLHLKGIVAGVSPREQTRRKTGRVGGGTKVGASH